MVRWAAPIAFAGLLVSSVPSTAEDTAAPGSQVDLPCVVAPNRYLPAPFAFELTITNGTDHPLRQGTKVTYSDADSDPSHPTLVKTFRLADLLPPHDQIHDMLPPGAEVGACHAWYKRRQRPDPDS